MILPVPRLYFCSPAGKHKGELYVYDQRYGRARLLKSELFDFEKGTMVQVNLGNKSELYFHKWDEGTWWRYSGLEVTKRRNANW